MITVVPGATEVPWTGYCESTSLLYCGFTLRCSVTADGTRPSLPSSALAASWVRPRSWGTVTFGGACAIVNVTVEPSAALPDTGDCASTVPGADADVWWIGLPTTNLSCCNSSLASVNCSPTTFGTATLGGPAEIVTTTREPCAPVAPPVGTVEITVFFAIIVDGCLTGETWKPAACSCRVAAAAFRPTTLGTWRAAGVPGPVEIVSVTTEFFASPVPADGIWAVTVPFGLDELANTYCGTRPRLWRFAWAVAFGCPISAGTFTWAVELCFSTSA
jgi:hypothetical protein